MDLPHNIETSIAKDDFTKEHLEHLLWDRWLNHQEIGSVLGITAKRVNYLIKKLGVKRRNTRVKDIRGQEFGKLKVVELANKLSGRKGSAWLCKCSCGRDKVVAASDILSNKVTTCGDSICSGNAKNLIDMRFGKLEVIGFEGYFGQSASWMCRCDCGEFAGPIQTRNLMSGNTKSCGCGKSYFEHTLGESIGILLPNCQIKKHAKFVWLGRQHLDGLVFKDNKTMFAYEYDGEQHFKPVRFGGVSQEQAELCLLKTINLDITKNKLCAENNIKLIRFSHKDIAGEKISHKIIKERIIKSVGERKFIMMGGN